jgi:hypothetical protein
MGTTSGSMLTYDVYMTLLLSATSAYDDQFNATKNKRHVMLHEILHDKSGTDDDHYHCNDALFDIDCPVSSIQAYATNFRPNSGSKSTSNKVLMPSNNWFSLSDSNKDIWDRLEDQAKGIILGCVTPTYPNSSGTRLINAAKSNGKHIPPGDICRVISKTSTRHVKLAQTQYYVSFHEYLTIKNLSLIVQGANGGVAGEDVRVIFRTCRTVDMKGIHNHHVNDIGIGTVGGVVNT